MPAVVQARFSREVLTEGLSRLPHVKMILVDQAGDRVSVWTVVDDFSLSVRKAIYAVQRHLIDEYHRFVRFEFHVIPDDGTTEIPKVPPLVTK